jgi:hypothetical protein
MGVKSNRVGRHQFEFIGTCHESYLGRPDLILSVDSNGRRRNRPCQEHTFPKQQAADGELLIFDTQDSEVNEHSFRWELEE